MSENQYISVIDETNLKKLDEIIGTALNPLVFIDYEQECDSIHDKLGVLTATNNTIDKLLKNDKRKNYIQSGEDIFFEVLLNEYPHLESRIQYITPDQLDIGTKKKDLKNKVNVPFCNSYSGGQSTYNLYSIFDAGKMPNVPIALSLSTFIDSASSPNNPTQYTNETNYAITDVTIGKAVTDELGLIVDENYNGIPSPIYTNISTNLLWQFTLYYCVGSRGNITDEFLKAIYILLHLRFELRYRPEDNNWSKKMYYCFNPDQNKYENNKKLQFDLYNAFQDIIFNGIYNFLLKTKKDQKSANNFNNLRFNEYSVSTFTWKQFTDTISKGNCRQHVRSYGWSLPSISKENNPKTTTFFTEINTYILPQFLPSEKPEEFEKNINLCFGQILKYSGDTSHIMCRRLMSIISKDRENSFKSVKCDNYKNISTILTIDRLLSVRSMINSKANEGVIVPMYAPLQTSRFNEWYKNNNIQYPKRLCYAYYIHKEITYSEYLDDIIKIYNSILDIFKSEFIRKLQEIELKNRPGQKYFNDTDEIQFNLTNLNVLPTDIIHSDILTHLNTKLEAVKIYKKITDNVLKLNKEYNVFNYPNNPNPNISQTPLQTIIDMMNNMIFNKSKYIRNGNVFTSTIATTTSKTSNLPNNYYKELENLELYYEKMLAAEFLERPENKDIILKIPENERIQYGIITVPSVSSIYDKDKDEDYVLTNLCTFIKSNKVRLSKTFKNNDGVNLYPPIKFPMEESRIEFIDSIINILTNILVKYNYNGVMEAFNTALIDKMKTCDFRPQQDGKGTKQSYKQNGGFSVEELNKLYQELSDLEQELQNTGLILTQDIYDDDDYKYIYVVTTMAQRKYDMYSDLATMINEYINKGGKDFFTLSRLILNSFKNLYTDDILFDEIYIPGNTLNGYLNNIQIQFQNYIIHNIVQNKVPNLGLIVNLAVNLAETLRSFDLKTPINSFDFLLKFELYILNNKYGQPIIPQDYERLFNTYQNKFIYNRLFPPKTINEPETNTPSGPIMKPRKYSKKARQDINPIARPKVSSFPPINISYINNISKFYNILVFYCTDNLDDYNKPLFKNAFDMILKLEYYDLLRENYPSTILEHIIEHGTFSINNDSLNLKINLLNQYESLILVIQHLFGERIAFKTRQGNPVSVELKYYYDRINDAKGKLSLVYKYLEQYQQFRQLRRINIDLIGLLKKINADIEETTNFIFEYLQDKINDINNPQLDNTTKAIIVENLKAAITGRGRKKRQTKKKKKKNNKNKNKNNNNKNRKINKSKNNRNRKPKQNYSRKKVPVKKKRTMKKKVKTR